MIRASAYQAIRLVAPQLLPKHLGILFYGFSRKKLHQHECYGCGGKVHSSPSCLVTTAGFSANGNNQVKLNNCGASIGGVLGTTAKASITIAGTGNIMVYNGNSTYGCGTCMPNPVGSEGAIPVLSAATIPSKNLNGSALATLP